MIRNTVKDFESIRMVDFLKPDANDVEQAEKPEPSLIDKPFNQIQFTEWVCAMSENIGENFMISAESDFYPNEIRSHVYLHSMSGNCSTGVVFSCSFFDGQLDEDCEDDFRQFEKDILNGKYK